MERRGASVSWGRPSRHRAIARSHPAGRRGFRGAASSEVDESGHTSPRDRGSNNDGRLPEQLWRADSLGQARRPEMSSKDLGDLCRKSACLHALTKDRSLERRPLPVPSRASRYRIWPSPLFHVEHFLCVACPRPCRLEGRSPVSNPNPVSNPSSISDPGRRDPSSFDRHGAEAEERSGERAVADDPSTLDVRR